MTGSWAVAIQAGGRQPVGRAVSGQPGFDAVWSIIILALKQHRHFTIRNSYSYVAFFSLLSIRTTLPRPSEISEKNVRVYLGKVIYDIPFMIQSHDESMEKILGAH